MPLAVADGDFPVGAEIDERGEAGAVADPGGDDSGEDVGAYEAADAAGKTNRATGWQVPAEFVRSEALLG